MNNKPIKLPIINRGLTIYKILKINVLSLTFPVFVLSSSWTDFNIYFSIIIYVPILIYSYFLFRKNNISGAVLIDNTIIVTHLKTDVSIPISDIFDIKQMLNLYYLSNFKMQNIYELSLRSKQPFHRPIYLEFDAHLDVTKEHELITNLRIAIEHIG